VWGNILNDFLRVEHNEDGTLRTDGTLSTKATLAGDLGGDADHPTVTGVHLSAPLTVAQGGTGTATQVFPVMRGTWAPNVAYTAKDIVQFQSSAFLCLSAHTSSPNVTGQTAAFGVDQAAGKWQQLSPRQMWYDVRDYGAKIDNTNDTAAIQAAIDACAAAGGGFVFLPPGSVRVTTVVLKNHVTLVGAGMWATTISSLSNTNAPVITNYVSPDGTAANAMFVGIRDLKVDGHLAGTGGGAGNTSAGAHGIYFNTNPANSMASGDDEFDPHQLVQNVFITNCAGWGFKQIGRGETRLLNVTAGACAQGGFAPTYDAFLASCSAGANGGPGFSFTHGNITAVNCKSFLSGHVSIGTSSNQPGYYLSGLAETITLSGCIAQNNNGAGFYLYNASGCILQACSADSNNYGAGNASDLFAGVELSNSTNCIVNVTSTQGYQSGAQVGNQYNALRIINNSDHNDIKVVAKAQVGYTLGPTVSSDSVLAANRIVADGVLINPQPKLTDSSDIGITNPGDGQVLAYNAASNTWVNTTSGSGTFAGGLFGDGSDGTVVLDGTATVPWASLSGGVYTMGRDCLTTSLTINSGITLFCAGYRIFCQGTIANNGTISANGNNATSASGAAASTSRSLTSGTKGGNGTIATGGTGNNATGGIAVGTGGAGGGGANGGGGGGGTILTTASWLIRSVQAFATGMLAFGGGVSALGGGSGGGGGGGDGTNTGGGGGSGGGIVCAFARSFANASGATLTSKGGSGFSPVAGNCGGGGGGGGGLIVIFTINPWVNNGAAIVSGGQGGTPSGTGVAGVTGNTGNILAITLQ
jgi:parallel beta-helix repeat protein